MPSRSRDSLLDAWRGLSVLLVIWSHIIGNNVAWSRLGLPLGSRPDINQDMHRFDHYMGQIGVQCFFVISGYIITTLLLREQERNQRASLTAFYVRRAFRILPPLWTVLAFVFVMKCIGVISVAPLSFLLASSFVCNVQLEHCGWFTGHLWSLGVEEQFYLLWPLLLVATQFRRTPGLVIFLTAALLLLAQIFFHTGESGIDNSMSFACIAIGCLYATSDTFRSLIARAAVLPLILLAGVLLLAQNLMPVWFHGQPRLQNLAHPVLICFIMFSCFRHRGFLERRLIVRGLASVGLISYGLYLWQQLFLGEATEYVRPSLLDFAPLCVVLALLSYFLIERPLMRVGARLSRVLTAP